MGLTELKVRNFTVFEQADFSFASGINVFLGENGTGKSHVLKVLYVALRGVPDPSADQADVSRLQRRLLAEIFKVGGGEDSALGGLVRVGNEDASIGAGKHEAHLVAEGLRKIATVLQLIDNGSIVTAASVSDALD